MVFNSTNPCQEFIFKGDIIECVQTFKYLRILFETNPNLDSAMEHLATVRWHSLFALAVRTTPPDALPSHGVKPT